MREGEHNWRGFTQATSIFQLIGVSFLDILYFSLTSSYFFYFLYAGNTRNSCVFFSVHTMGFDMNVCVFIWLCFDNFLFTFSPIEKEKNEIEERKKKKKFWIVKPKAKHSMIHMDRILIRLYYSQYKFYFTFFPHNYYPSRKRKKDCEMFVKNNVEKNFLLFRNRHSLLPTNSKKDAYACTFFIITLNCKFCCNWMTCIYMHSTVNLNILHFPRSWQVLLIFFFISKSMLINMF